MNQEGPGNRPFFLNRAKLLNSPLAARGQDMGSMA
jgi:hypothetical protein